MGAKPQNILAQFLIEAVTLSAIGGLVGIAAGVPSARWAAGRFGWPMLRQPSVLLLAVGFSALVGVGLGLYPAGKAARLDPIEGLRYE